MNHNSTDQISAEEYNKWRQLPICQQPAWPDLVHLEQVLATVRSLPPHITHYEVDQCRQHLAKVLQGQHFIIHAGTCAERFIDCNKDIIQDEVDLLHEMAQVFEGITGRSAILIGRIAGQYAKPRSLPLPNAYRGDMANEFGNEENFTTNADRLLTGYYRSVATTNCIRSLLLHTEPKPEVYQNGGQGPASKSPNQIYTSHEALLLNYEDALTYQIGQKWYNLSAPFVWFGDRTRQLDHAHVYYASCIQNPMGIKVGPGTNPQELVDLLRLIWKDPAFTPGKITLITRLGFAKVANVLPVLIQAVQSTGLPIIWICDPCHGNTTTTSVGYKTRVVDKMLAEFLETLKVHAALGSRLGGVHLEITAQAVTECIGGDVVGEACLGINYTTYCDPRLNRQQSLDFIQIVAKAMVGDLVLKHEFS